MCGSIAPYFHHLIETSLIGVRDVSRARDGVMCGKCGQKCPVGADTLPQGNGCQTHHLICNLHAMNGLQNIKREFDTIEDCGANFSV